MHLSHLVAQIHEGIWISTWDPIAALGGTRGESQEEDADERGTAEVDPTVMTGGGQGKESGGGEERGDKEGAGEGREHEREGEGGRAVGEKGSIKGEGQRQPVVCESWGQGVSWLSASKVEKGDCVALR